MNTAANFTNRVQLAFIVVLVLALVAIGQPWSFALYKWAVWVMIAGGLAQIAVGNVPLDASPARFARLLAIFVSAIVGLFVVSILLAPVLVELGR